MAVEDSNRAEIQFSGFAYTTIDQSSHARAHAPHAGRSPAPCAETPLRAASIAEPPRSPEAMFAHIPGIRVVYPSSPRRAYGLLLAASATPIR